MTKPEPIKPRWIVVAVVVLTAAVILASGCASIQQLNWDEIDKAFADWAKEQADKPPVTPQDEPEPPADPLPVATDSSCPALDWGGIKWISENYSGAVQADAPNLTASGGYSGFRYASTPYSWPTKTVKVSVDAVACHFAWDGSQWVGGKYDWIRKGGQNHKGIENLAAGYGGLSIPKPGTWCAHAWVSVDGKKRSNLSAFKWQ